MDRKLTEHQRALLFEADVIEAQSQDVTSLSKSRKRHLAHSAERLRALAAGEYPYIRVSYGSGIRALRDEETGGS